jgi:hypothetical protein|tara:strand:+ start:430 stop:828 length:399 start_codon:yes stop_codon:yes gene_type:complete
MWTMTITHDIISGTEGAYLENPPFAQQDYATGRKEMPIFSGVLNYFPDAIREVSKTSWTGNQQHHPDKPLHWDRSKSGDELDALARHLMEAGTTDSDGVKHSAKVAWRALANLQKELEREGKAPLSEYNEKQ